MKKKYWRGLSSLLAILLMAVVACTKEPTPDPVYPGGGGNGGGSGSGSVPSAPTGVSATVSGSQIHVSWNRVSNAKYYEIYYSQSSSGSYSYIDDIWDTETYISYSYGNLPTGDYYFKLKLLMIMEVVHIVHMRIAIIHPVVAVVAMVAAVVAVLLHLLQLEFPQQ